MAHRSLRPRSCDNAPLVNYLQILPDDVNQLMLAYVLYDSKQDHTYTMNVFAQPLFRSLTNSSLWQRLLADRPRVLYRTYWSSNNYTAARFLHFDGTIDYAPLLSHVSRNIPDDANFGDLGDGSRACWSTAAGFRCDLRLTALRDQLALRLAERRSELHADRALAIRCLTEIFSLNGPFLVSHLPLEEEIIGLCDSLGTGAYEFLRRDKSNFNAAFGFSVNHNFWLLLYGKYIEPQIGTALRKGDPMALPQCKVDNWDRAWFTAALWTNDVVIFTQAYTELGYTRDDITESIISDDIDRGCLDMNMMYQADADQIIAALDLWDRISPEDVADQIILRAPRLQTALQARGYSFTLPDLSTFYYRDLPSRLRPFLPAEATPLLITLVEAPSASLLLALLEHSQRPLSWSEICFMFMCPALANENLINYVLPVERVVDPAFRSQLPYLAEQWGALPAPDDGAAGIGQALTAHWSNYRNLYRLFLLYFATQRSLPRTPFHCYDSGEVFYGRRTPYHTNLTTRTPVDGPKCTLFFHPRPHTRVFVMDRAAGVILSLPLPQIIYTHDMMYVFIPAQHSLTVANFENNTSAELYDYDVDDFAWLVGAFTKYYGDRLE